ncbi:MAG TPA: hypothetical protein VJH55_02015 [Candidatus Paceibacterota bacterium]
MKTKITSRGTNPFSTETKTFIRNLPTLLKTNSGEYVVIQGRQILLIAKNEREAIKKGQEKGKRGFILIQRIERIAETLEKNRQFLEDHEAVKPNLTPKEWERLKTNQRTGFARRYRVDPGQI